MKTERAIAARLPGFTGVKEPSLPPPGMVRLGNEWTCGLFDGWFYRAAPDAGRQEPAVSLVFVQSAEGNTEVDDPSELGGGETDTHLVYEGLSRVDADAVLAGSTTAAGPEIVFSVWHPELVGLREERGRPRHPAQIIATQRGSLPVETALLYNEPSLRVIVLASTQAAAALQRQLLDRTWIEVIDTGESLDLRRGLREVRARELAVVSAVGGRRIAQELLRIAAVSELYLTTSAVRGGNADTPLTAGPLPAHRVLVVKQGRGNEQGVRFEHLVFERSR